MKVEPVILQKKETSIQKLLSYFMGKNTPERQRFIIDNLKVEECGRAGTRRIVPPFTIFGRSKYRRGSLYFTS